MKKSTWGFTLQRNGKQIRKAGYETREAAEEALAKERLGLREPDRPAASLGGLTFAQAVERYIGEKTRSKKSIREDERQLRHLTTAFGASTPLAEITASAISAYKATRMATQSRQTRALLSAASVNRPLALLRHLLRLAKEEWEVLSAVPRIRLEREPEHRIRWLEPDEEARLRAACQASSNPWLYPIVVVALESGMRRSELLRLTWEQIDLSRGLIRLEKTKSGRRREVPMRQEVYDILSKLPDPRSGRVWPVTSIRSAFERAVVEAKLQDFHMHDCRHHFSSWWVMREGTLAALKDILGHRTLAMTMKYAHLNRQHLLAEVAKTERKQADSAHDQHKVVESPAPAP
jgi:integrase